MADTEARWYCVNAQGLPMLCASKEDAEREAARNDKVWPKGAPHRAVQLCDAAERDRLRAQVEDMRAAVHSCHPGCSNARCVAERLRADVAELVRVLDRVAGEGPLTLAQLDAAHGTARALIAKHNVAIEPRR